MSDWHLGPDGKPHTPITDRDPGMEVNMGPTPEQPDALMDEGRVEWLANTVRAKHYARTRGRDSQEVVLAEECMKMIREIARLRTIPEREADEGLRGWHAIVGAQLEELARDLWPDDDHRHQRTTAEIISEARARLRTIPERSPEVGERVERDDEGRPYPCGAFVSGDGRWFCRLESDHAGEHEWVLRTPTEPERGETFTLDEVLEAWMEAESFRAAHGNSFSDFLIARLRARTPTEEPKR